MKLVILRQPAALLVTLASLVFAVPATAAQTEPSKRCHPRKSTTVAESAQARVYTTSDTGPTYGCWQKTGRRHRLSGHAATDAQLAGRYVAYVIFRTDPTLLELRVFDLKRGKLFRRVDSYTDDFKYQFTSYLLTYQGFVAWIVTDWSFRPKPAGRLYRLDSRGEALLDEGGYAIRPYTIGALALDKHGERVYWYRKSTTPSEEGPQSATLE